MCINLHGPPRDTLDVPWHATCSECFPNLSPNVSLWCVTVAAKDSGVSAATRRGGKEGRSPILDEDER